VTGIQQVGFGIVDCRIPLGDDAFILASLDESAISICDDVHRLIEGISGLSCHAACGQDEQREREKKYIQSDQPA
jgi:hypothetical protein